MIEVLNIIFTTLLYIWRNLLKE